MERNSKAFKEWKKWFLDILKVDIAKENGWSWDLEMDCLIRFLPDTNRGTYFYEKKICDKQQKFLVSFLKCCQRFGFNPSSKADIEIFEVDGGDNEWTPNRDEFSHSFAKNCYGFYVRQMKVQRAFYQNVLSTKAEAYSGKKNRLPVMTTIVLIYFFETYKGKSELLNELRNYLKDHRGLIKDCEKILESMKSKIIASKEAESSDLQKINVPESINKLMLSRGEADISRWRAHWVHDLYRLVLSQHERKIIKAMNKKHKKIKSILKTEILNKGSAVLKDKKYNYPNQGWNVDNVGFGREKNGL